MDEIEVDSLSLVQRLALLSISRAVDAGDDPVDSREVKTHCEELLRHVEADVVSEPAERDIIRALSALGGESYVTEKRADQSPTGKGRPSYTLGAGVEAVLDALAEDDRLDDAVLAVRE